jgi:hypothetical protein
MPIPPHCFESFFPTGLCMYCHDKEGDGPDVRPSPSRGGTGRLDIALNSIVQVSNRILFWGMRICARQTSRQNMRLVFFYSTRRAIPERRVNSTLPYVVSLTQNRCRMYQYELLGKMGAMFPPSAKLQLPQEKGHSFNSGRSARRDNLSQR